MSQKNKPSRDGSAPSFKIPSAATLACMGLLSGVSAMANAGPAPTIVAIDDNYVTPINSVLTSNGTTVQTLANNDTYNGNAISAMQVCPRSGNVQTELLISVLTPPSNGSVVLLPHNGNVTSQAYCDNATAFPNTFGGFQYTPVPGYTGTDSFVYAISIGNHQFANATATILVSPQFTASGGALDPALLLPLAAAGLARRRKKKDSDQ